MIPALCSSALKSAGSQFPIKRQRLVGWVPYALPGRLRIP